MLHAINRGGIRAYCPDLIVEGEPANCVYLLSVAGQQNAVKGILASLLENHTVRVSIAGTNHYLSKAPEPYRMMVTRLPSGNAQGMVLLQSALVSAQEAKPPSRFLLLSHDPAQNQGLLFRHLQQRLEIPLHKSWDGWLWQLFESREWLSPLTTLAGHYQGFLVQLDQQALHQAISEALAENHPQLCSCFEAA